MKLNQSEYDHIKKRLEQGLAKEDITVPRDTLNSVADFVMAGTPQGHFLTAVLSNDLRAAVSRADLINRRCLVDLVVFLFNHAPAVCWGSAGLVQDWIEDGGAKGMLLQGKPKN